MLRILSQAHFTAAAIAGVGVVFVGAALTAQEPERFEVVSIKPHPEPIGFTRDTVDGVSYHAVGRTLLSLIEDAYSLGRFQISGGPKWLTSAYFDVEAKASGSVPLTWERAIPMLQAMLGERFQLKVRRQMREVACYDLVAAKGGPKLKENTDPAPPGGVATSADVNRGHMRADNGTMARLAMNLTVPAGRPVVDKTGLAGKYHIALDYAADNSPEAANGTMLTLFTALEDQLGLKLEPSRRTLDTLVIESVEKPSGN
jgi:uncharacterized protein (TIGR03435 family)